VTTALVTGAAGFVGANLTRRLVANGHEAHVLVRAESRTWRIDDLARDVTRHEVDLEDAAGVLRAVEAARAEWIFHLAARGAYAWQADAGEILRTNVVGTANMIDAAARAGFGAFVNAGTSSEYGPKDHAPREDEALAPSSAYAVAKASATMLCTLFGRESGDRVLTLRLYSVFGPWEEPGRLLPNLIVHGLAGRLPALADPGAAHDFVHVDDVVDAFLRAAAGGPVEPGSVFNVGSGVQTTIGEAVSVARRVLGVEAEPRWGTMEPRPWDTAVWVADRGRIGHALGWAPMHTFEEGFRRQAEWFRARPQLLPLYERLANERTAVAASAAGDSP